jgi:hypothetical protein
MKRNIFFIIIAFLICTAFNKSNKYMKYTNNSLCTDYRDAYVGSYVCKSSTTIVSIDKAPYIKKGTITVLVAKDALDSIIQITIGSNNHRFKLKSSVLYAYPVGGHSGGNFFASDSISLNISLGHAAASRLKGKKI